MQVLLHLTARCSSNTAHGAISCIYESMDMQLFELTGMQQAQALCTATSIH